MPLVKYRIYELSARAVISYGRQQDGTYTFHLSAAETEKCKSLSAPHEQDDNALFYQIMCVLHGDAFTGRPGGQLVTDLSDIIFYIAKRMRWMRKTPVTRRSESTAVVLFIRDRPMRIQRLARRLS